MSIAELRHLESLGRIAISVDEFDCGRRVGWSVAGWSVAVLDGSEHLLQHAAMVAAYDEIEPPLYGPVEKVYVTPAEWAANDEDDGVFDGPLLADEVGFYVERQPMVKPGVYRKRGRAEMEGQALTTLCELLGKLRRAGELLRPWP